MLNKSPLKPALPCALAVIGFGGPIACCPRVLDSGQEIRLPWLERNSAGFCFLLLFLFSPVAVMDLLCLTTVLLLTWLLTCVQTNWATGWIDGWDLWNWSWEHTQGLWANFKWTFMNFPRGPHSCAKRLHQRAPTRLINWCLVFSEKLLS